MNTTVGYHVIWKFSFKRIRLIGSNLDGEIACLNFFFLNLSLLVLLKSSLNFKTHLLALHSVLLMGLRFELRTRSSYTYVLVTWGATTFFPMLLYNSWCSAFEYKTRSIPLEPDLAWTRNLRILLWNEVSLLKQSE